MLAQRSKPKVGAVAVAIALVFAAVVLGARWRANPSAFAEVGDRQGLTTQVGRGVVVNLWVDPSHPVELRDIEPVVSGTARADVEIHLCQPGPGGMVGTGLLADLAKYCPNEVPVAGSAMEPIAKRVQPDRYVVATVVPRSPGTVVIDGARVGYSDGLRRGVQQTGLRSVITATP